MTASLGSPSSQFLPLNFYSGCQTLLGPVEPSIPVIVLPSVSVVQFGRQRRYIESSL